MSPLSPANFDSAYTSMIAGAIPLHSGDVDKTVFMIAQDVLGTSRMHLLVATDPASQMVYYFAAPSVSFTSIAVFATPLAAALPSHPQHQGDGIYFLQDVNLAVAVEKTRDQIRVVANSNEAMADWLAERPETPLYRVDDYQAWAMESIPGAYRRLADGISLRTAKYSSIISVLSLLIYFIASIGTSIQSAAADKSNQAHMTAINSAVTKIDFVSPMSQQVARMQRVSALVVRAGGWIEEYQVKDGAEKFVLMMPAWITKDYIDALGSAVVADQSTEENLVRVSLGMPLPGTTAVKRPLPLPIPIRIPASKVSDVTPQGAASAPALPNPAPAGTKPPATTAVQRMQAQK